MNKATFYHAGCPVCQDAEKNMLGFLDQAKIDLEVVDFNNDASRIGEAESAGVKSVPALVLDGQTYHINYGASMDDVKNS